MVPTPGIPTVAPPEPGFQSWTTPRTFDAPGTVFQINDGVREFVGVFSDPTKRGEEAFAEVFSSGTWTGSVLANFTGTGSSSISADGKQDYEVSLRLEGATRWGTDEAKVLEKLKAGISTLPYNPKSNLYLVAEATAVTSVDIVVRIGSNGSVIAQLTPGAVLPGYGNAKVVSNDGSTVTLRRTFATPHYLFYRPKLLSVQTGLNEVTIVPLPVTEVLTYSAERER